MEINLATAKYEEESMLNPLTPMDSVAAFAMAKLLTEGEMFDYCVPAAAIRSTICK